MPPKRQHYVPKTYLKSWEVSFPTKDNSNEPSTGVFVYTKSNGSAYIKKKIDSILYMSSHIS